MNYNGALHITWNSNVNPDKDALVFGDKIWSYIALESAVSETAALLRHAGVGRGDRVAILGLNSDEYVIACLAGMRIGAVSVLLNYRLTINELSFLINDAEPKALLLDEEFYSTHIELLSSCASISFTAVLHSESEHKYSLESRRALHKGEIVENVLMGPDDLDRILYTSGTTGRPKGAMLSHGNAAWNLLTQVLEGCCQADERTLVFAPLYHIGAQELPGMRVFALGATMVIMRRFDPTTVLENVQKFRITGMVLISTMVHMLCQLPNSRDYNTGSLRWLVFGQVPENMLGEIRSIFPNAALKNSYGLTEICSTATSIDDINQRIRPLSPGRCTPTVELKIVDDNDNEIRHGELGEIILRSPKVMLGYWRMPEETAEVLKGGWLHTGDVGYVDEFGFLFIVDRKKDMIRTGGENVSSQELERVIFGMGTVAEVAVVSIPDEKWGEAIKAVIVAHPGKSVTADDVLAHCKSHLASFKIPKVIEFRQELPRNPSGKVLKRQLI